MTILLKRKNLNSRKKEGVRTLGKFIDFKGYKLFLRDEGAGQDTILVHGFPDHSENLNRLFEGLSPKQRVIAFDRLGSGRSDKPEKPYGLSDSVEELNQLWEQLELNPMVLIGHSIGGTISTLYAARFPKRVRALILINPALKDFKIQTGMGYLGAWFLRKPLIGEIMLKFQNRFSTKQCLKLAFYKKTKISDELVDSYHFPFYTQGGKRSYIREMRAIYEILDDQILSHIDQVKNEKIPVLLVWTEKDWSMPLTDGREFSKRFGSRLHTVPECGHSPHLELDDLRLMRDLIAPIQDFLNKI